MDLKRVHGQDLSAYSLHQIKVITMMMTNVPVPTQSGSRMPNFARVITTFLAGGIAGGLLTIGVRIGRSRRADEREAFARSSLGDAGVLTG